MKIEQVMNNYTFTSDEIRKLKEYRDNQSDPNLKCRFIALLILAVKKVKLSELSDIIGKSVKTVKRWFKKYYLKGADALNSFDYKPKKPYLTEKQIEEVVTRVKQAPRAISELFGISLMIVSASAILMMQSENSLKRTV